MENHVTTIALVEDDEDDYILTRDLLAEVQRGQFELHWVASYDAALKVMQESQHDIYLVDYRLGEHNGVELLREALAQGLQAPVILLTGQGNREVDVEAMQSGAADYLVKGQIDSFLLERAIRYAVERKQAAEALRHSEEYFRSLIENAADLIVVVNLALAVRYVSPSVERVLGLPPTALLGQNALDFIHLEEASQLMEIIGTPLGQSGTTQRLEHRLRHANGSWRWFESTGRTRVDEDGELSVIINARDITERKQAEADLRQRFEQLQIVHELTEAVNQASALSNIYSAALEGMARALGAERSAVLLVDPDGVMRFKAWRGLSKTYRAAVEGHSLWPVDASDPHPVLVADIATDSQVASVRTALQAEGLQAIAFIPLRHRERLVGKFMLYYTSPHSFRTEEIRLAQTLADQVAFAVERQRAQIELKRLSRHNQLILDSAGEGIYGIDLEGRITFINPVGAQWLGYIPEELLGQSKHGLIHHTRPDGSPYPIAECPIYATLRDGAVHHVDDEVFWRKNGTRFLVEYTSTPIYDSSGGLTGAVVIFTDITKRKEAETRLLRETARAEALLRIASRLSAQLDLDKALEAVCEETARALNVFAVTLALYDVNHDHFAYAATFGLPPEFKEQALTFPRELYDKYVRTANASVTFPDMQALTDLPNAALFVRYNIRTCCTAGLYRGEQCVGVLNALTLDVSRTFTSDEEALLKGLADQAAQAIANARLFSAAERRIRHVQALHSIDTAIASVLDLRLSLNIYLEQVVQELGVDAAAVFLLHPRTHQLEYIAGRGFQSEAITRAMVRLGEELVGRVALERRVISLPNWANEVPLFTRRPYLAHEGFQAYYGLPLVAKGAVMGVLEIFHRVPLQPDAEWLNFLETLAGQGAIAVENAQLFESLQRSNIELRLAYDTTLEGWSRALDLRDRETEGHSQRVTDITLRLAQAVDMGEDQLTHIRWGALLHDIGKMGIPDSILLKPGPLTDTEWFVMRQHPQYAYDLLAPITFLHSALDIPYCHHEKWDGTGYPRGLKNDQIPLAARLFAVVDVWDALRSDRPYRAAWPEEKVIAHLQSFAGTHFDPQAVEVFLQVRHEVG